MWQHSSPFTESRAARRLVSLSTQNRALSRLWFLHRVAPKDQRTVRPTAVAPMRPGPMVQPRNQAEFLMILGGLLPAPDRFAWL